MTSPFHYSTTYVLDKSHFAETFDQTATVTSGVEAYKKALLLMLVGLVVLTFTPVDPYIAGFIIAIGCVEALSVRFQRAWWLARQSISRAGNVELTLTITEEGVTSESIHVQSTLLWQEINHIDSTSEGWLLRHDKGKTYLSKRILSEQAQQFLFDKATEINRSS